MRSKEIEGIPPPCVESNRSKGGDGLKKYSVDVMFKNGMIKYFETNSNIKELKPRIIGRGKFIITEDKHLLDINRIIEINVRHNF